MEHIKTADESTLFWLENHHSTAGNVLMKFGTHLGDASTVIALAAAAMILFYLLGRRRTAGVMLLASLLALSVAESVKYLVQRDRPDVAWRLIERPHSPSFPSGHSLNSMAIYGTFALLAARHFLRRLPGFLLVVAGFTLPLLIGVSRPYLGVHYPSDVLAGWTAGLACAVLAFYADRLWGDRPRFLPSVDPSSLPQPLPSPVAGSEAVRSARDVSGFHAPN